MKLAAAFLIAVHLCLGAAAVSALASPSAADQTITRSYCLRMGAEVDRLVNKEFFDPALLKNAWAPAYDHFKEEICAASASTLTLPKLDSLLNSALQTLHTSHCQFLTQNDESFFFLHSLFGTLSRANRTRAHSWARPVACVGFATGGCGFEENQIRYVLDAGPADRAGLQIGDHILKVAGKKYCGYLDFFGQEGKALSLDIERSGATKSLTITPLKKDLYKLYVEATTASKRIIQRGKYTIGYVHLWAGGSAGAEAVRELVCGDLKDVDGLIYDLRDGYGGASLEDLDVFYRSPAAFPELTTIDREGKINGERSYFNKPIVTLINSGSRSGKELLAYSLKNSKRSTLVGGKTAGAVVAGKLTPIDDQCALYLSIVDIKLDGVRLEGQGVAPDIAVDNEGHDPNGYGLQLSRAIEALEKRLSGQN